MVEVYIGGPFYELMKTTTLGRIFDLRIPLACRLETE